MTYAVKLPVFDGPLDLLLQLVSRERVDVADVSVSTITEEYLRALRRMEEVDIELASGFLVLAATLLELKTIKLLPRAPEDPELAALLEERDHLVHRLIEYSTFKKAAEAIARLLGQNQGYHPRLADIPPELLHAAPDLLEGVTPDHLRETAVRMLAPKTPAPLDTSYIAPIRVSVREMIDRLASLVAKRGTTSFRDLCPEPTARMEVIVRFLALLELFKRASVDVEQHRPFDEIIVRWRQPSSGSGR